MHTSIVRRALPKLLILSLIALALGFAGLQSGTRTDTADAQSFNAQTTASVSTRALGANADIAQNLTIASGDYNFGGVFTNSPPQGDLHDLYFAPGGSGPLVGDIVGTLSSSTFLGLTNLNCSSALTVNFVLMNAVNDNSAGVVIPDNTPPTGGQGRLYPYLQNDGVAQDGNPAAQSNGANGLPAGVEEYPSFLQDIFNNGSPYYPDVRYWGGTVVANSAVTLNFMIFGPGDLAANEPAPSPAFDMSANRVGYTSITVLNDTSATASPSSITEFCSPLTTDTLLYGQSKANPCQPAGACPAGGGVIEPCSVLAGDAPPATCDSLASSGRIRWENPGAGGGESGTCVTECTRIFSAFHFSLRDTDGDGLENSFDACAFTSTPGVQQRVGTNDTDDDADSDMLMGGGPNGGCDPTPGTNTGSGNHDGDTFTNGDGWLNGGDNCPLIVNGSNYESELDEPDNVRAPRGGPGTDSHGDECDGAESGAQCSNTTDDDGDGLVNDGCPIVGSLAEPGCLNGVDDLDEDPITAGQQNDDTTHANDGCPSSARVATGAWYATLTISPVCFSNSAADDDDGDGVCDASTPTDAFYTVAIPADPNDGNASLIPESYSLIMVTPVANSGAVNAVRHICNDGVDNDGASGIDLLDSAAGKCRPPTSLSFMTADTDGDGFSDEAEVYMGTDAMGRCGVGGVPAVSPDWPADLADGGGTSRDRVNISDLASFVAPPPAKLNKSPGGAGFDRRWDVVPGPGALLNWINTLDLAQMTVVVPPMLGVKAYNFASVCSAHPTLND